MPRRKMEPSFSLVDAGHAATEFNFTPQHGCRIAILCAALEILTKHGMDWERHMILVRAALDRANSTR